MGRGSVLSTNSGDQTLRTDIRHVKTDNGINTALSQDTGLFVKGDENPTGKGLLLTRCILMMNHSNHLMHHWLLIFLLVYP